MGLAQMVMNIILNNPNMQQRFINNPVTANYLNVLKSGDQAQGEALANQLLQTYGLSKEEAIQQAQQGLMQRFGRPN